MLLLLAVIVHCGCCYLLWLLCRWLWPLRLLWLWREACAGIKKVYACLIIHSGNFWSGDQCSGQAHKISA